MERISLEVPENIAVKWQHASKEQKERAVEAVKHVLDTPDAGAQADGDKEIRFKEARDFFTKLSGDFTDYKFNREEANER